MSQTIGGGYQGTRVTRCTDKFVRYPYPKRMQSTYQETQKDFLRNTLVVKKGDAFNLEKEAKIINPHRVDTTTINAKVYKQHILQPKEKIKRSAFVEYKPSVE